MLAAGETASAEDAATIDARVTSLHEEFIDNGLVPWALTAIPERAVAPFAIIVAADAWRPFNGEEGLVEAEQKAVAARARLARQAQRITGEVGTAEYF